MRRGASGEVLRVGCEPRSSQFPIGGDSRDIAGGAIHRLASVSRRSVGVRVWSGAAGDVRVRPLGGTRGRHGAGYAGNDCALAASIPIRLESHGQRARRVRGAGPLVLDVWRGPARASGAFLDSAGVVRSGIAHYGMEPDLYAR